MSQTRLQVTLVLALVVVLLVGAALFVLSAYLLPIFISLGALLFIGLVGFAWHKWQHARLPIKADKREALHLAHLHEMERERLRLERERHTQQLQMEQEKHQLEVQLLQREFDLRQHLALTRIQPDGKGYYPYMVTPEGDYLPLPNVNMRLLQQPGPPQESENSLSLQAGAAGSLPTHVRYEEIRHQVPRGHTLLGISAQGLETRPYAVLSTCWIVGGSKTGKTNTVALKVEEAYQQGSRFLVVDPHAFKHDSLYNAIKGYAQRFLLPMAQEVEEILPVLDAFLGEFERRKQTGDCPYPLTLVVDEVGSLVSEKPDTQEEQAVIDKLKKIARICGQEARGFEMYGLFISQDAAGLAWLRKRAMTVIAHKVLMMSERQLVCNQNMELARSMDSWPIGRVLVYGLAFDDILVLQQPVFTPTRQVVEADHLPPMEPLVPKPFRGAVRVRNSETLRVSGGETARQAETSANVSSAFLASRSAPAARAKKETAQVSAETRKIIVRMYREHLPLRRIAKLVGLSGEKYGLFKQVCEELGIGANDLKQDEVKAE